MRESVEYGEKDTWYMVPKTLKCGKVNVGWDQILEVEEVCNWENDEMTFLRIISS